jgi:hypothetical protein
MAQWQKCGESHAFWLGYITSSIESMMIFGDIKKTSTTLKNIAEQIEKHNPPTSMGLTALKDKINAYTKNKK